MIRFLNSLTPFLLFCLLILLFPRIIKGQQFCSGTTYAPNSTYHTNLISLLSSLSSNAIQSYGFYNTTVGQNSDNTVYGLFLCRGDLAIAACDRCVSTAINDITTPQKCPNTTQAVGWYGYECMIRYSDTYIFSVEDVSPFDIFYNVANATDQMGFMELALDTLNAVAKQAAYGRGGKKFATKEVDYSNFQTIYSMVQCTPDLSADACYSCLRTLSAEFSTCCFGKIGGVVVAASCTLRYEVYPFYSGLLTSFNFDSSEADIPAYYAHNCTINNSFTSDSHYQFNLNTLLISLYSKATATDTTPKFYNNTVGTLNMNDTVYGEYMCRGDVPMEVCQNCVQDASSRIASECPYNREAIIWYDQCSVRYSDRYFFSTLHQLPNVNSFLTDDDCSQRPTSLGGGGHVPRCIIRSDTILDSLEVTSQKGISESELSRTLNNAVVEAETSTKRFATKEASLASGESLYTLVQCTPDLSPQFCSKCLYGLIKLIPTNYTGIRGRILNPSCNLRSEGDRFYYKGNQPPSDFISQESRIPSLAHWNCSNTKANYTINDSYLNNLGNLFEDLSKSSNITNNNGFYSTMIGNKSNTVYGLFMCRGDVSLQLCNECVNEGIEQLNRFCSSSKEAIIWYDMCMLRYSNRSFFSTVDTQPIYTQRGTDMLQNQKDGFNRQLADTLNDLVTATLKSTPIGAKNFATQKEFSSSEFRPLYTLAQCTPNLNSQDCQKCLNDAQQQITSCCLGTKGGTVMNPSCNLRFELYRFYNNHNMSSISVPPSYPPNNSGVSVITKTITGKNKDNSRTIIIAVFLSVVSITLFCFGVCYWQRKNRQLSHTAILKKNFGSEGATLESLQFNFTTIEDATDKFSIENRIGKGGFGEVYMGVLSDGSKIAVKRLSENSNQGSIEFNNEVLLIAKLQHRNLVALLGFCLKDQEKILVYEYVPNKSLDYFLFGSQKPREFNWPKRYKIIEGIAQGIHYLHEHSRLKVIHRDLKPSNILLDDEMNPKISDFGMARMVGINETRGSTNRIVGTLGYMSPEYLKFGLFSEKSDVFSFGVIVLEIISGKNINSHDEYHESQYHGGLLSDAWKHWRGENLIAILDSNMTEIGSHNEIMRCIQIGLLCVQGNPQVRPSMNKVVKYLSNDSMKLSIPHEPAFFLHSQMEAAETNRAIEAQLANHNQYSINEISESVSFPR